MGEQPDLAQLGLIEAAATLPSVIAGEQPVFHSESLAMEKLQLIRKSLARAQSIDDLRRAFGDRTLGARGRLEGEAANSSYVLALDIPVAALDLCHALRWESCYAVSPDVHQQSWIIMLRRGTFVSSFGPRIDVGRPKLGRWAVSAHLKTRPRGVLPKEMAGPSPAYDLRTHAAEVQELEVRLWDENDDLSRQTVVAGQLARVSV